MGLRLPRRCLAVPKRCIGTQLGGALGGNSTNAHAPDKPCPAAKPGHRPGRNNACHHYPTRARRSPPAYRGHLDTDMTRSQTAPGCRMSRPNLAMSTYPPTCTHLCGRTTRPHTYKDPQNCHRNSTKSHMDRCANTYLGGQVPRHSPSQWPALVRSLTRCATRPHPWTYRGQLSRCLPVCPSMPMQTTLHA